MFSQYQSYKKLKYINNSALILEERSKNFISLPLNFKFCSIQEINQKIDAINLLYKKIKFTNNYIAYESYSTATIEGAVSTIADTIKLVDGTKKPKNKSENMIQNNINAIKFLNKNGFKFVEADILNLWNLLTKDVLDNKEIQGIKYRNDNVIVGKHKPPSADKLDNYMEIFIDFCNDRISNINPYIKAAIIQFMFVWIHPFCDGNGRTGRILSTQYLINSGLEKYKKISISSLILKTREKYYKSLKESENEYNDITFFIIYYLDIIYNTLIDATNNFYQELSSRQLKVVDFLKNGNFITIKTYSNKFNISLDEAQKELLYLASLDILQLQNNGHFIWKK